LADILQMEEANTRQLVSRARKHVADGQRTPVSSGEQRRLLEAFLAAAQRGEMAALESLFQEGTPRFKDCPVACGAAQAKASDYLNSAKKTARLLARVWSKASWNYDALLSAWE
jgi:RNA polymerase sigma-70 factor (ECF subfamily)